jgi:murein DD-endopeptidase MepM/ murein hydrolase activator NlpD
MRVRWLWVPVALLVVAGAACFPSGGQVIGNFRCPVDGSTYRDDFAAPRSGGRVHGGIDMHAPARTPVWAVKAGNVQYALESFGGLVAYLFADDGNVYYYAHMSEKIGSDRRVAQGDQIGFVGQTGNATSPHLHFEVRLGGINGQRTNPYSTLRNARC